MMGASVADSATITAFATSSFCSECDRDSLKGDPMKASASVDRVVPLAKVIVVTIAAGVAGCAVQSGPGSPPSTPYKGDAPWNISSTDGNQQAIFPAQAGAQVRATATARQIGPRPAPG
jgi:hypothetical protein